MVLKGICVHEKKGICFPHAALKLPFLSAYCDPAIFRSCQMTHSRANNTRHIALHLF